MVYYFWGKKIFVGIGIRIDFKILKEVFSICNYSPSGNCYIKFKELKIMLNPETENLNQYPLEKISKIPAGRLIN
jgi:hypothetical protein